MITNRYVVSGKLYVSRPYLLVISVTKELLGSGNRSKVARTWRSFGNDHA